MNFVAEVVEAADPAARALVAVERDGSRREWRFGEVAAEVRATAASLAGFGLRQGDVVLTLIGNRPEWVFAMCACFRQGWVALPCNEQLRGADLALRIAAARVSAVVCDERNRETLREAGWSGPTLWVPKGSDPFRTSVPKGSDPFRTSEAPPPTSVGSLDPCLVTFTSGTAGEPKGVVHGQRYLSGQTLQAEHWLAPAAGDLVWCTAASGWSKSARNVFIAPWLRGAAALLHDARFDPEERLALIEREHVNVLCMAPTEYRAIAKRTDLRPLPSLRGAVAAGEALNPEVLEAWRDAVGLEVRDGYGQTETGQLTGNLVGEPARPGSMGRPLPGVRLWLEDGELVLDPATDPTFFVGYVDGGVPPDGPWHTGDRVTQDEDGHLYFEGRADDLIISAGYRIGPFEVESALVAHPAVAEAAVVAAPDDERGAVVRAVVVLRDGFAPGAALARDLQEHVKSVTAPYKYPRIVDFAGELPKTASGKVRRAELRQTGR